MPKLLVIVTVVAAALLAAGCATTENQAPTTTPTPAVTQAVTPAEAITVIDEEMNESTVVVKLNSRFALELAENPSTGYSWNLTATDGLRVVADEYVPPGTSVVGAPGTHRWEIEAVAVGLQAIEGVYRRSWEGTTTDADTFMVEIAVEA